MMSKEFIKVMGNRQSFSRLFDPPPDTKLMKDILVASLRSPDHMGLRPYRFILISGKQRDKLGELFAEHKLDISVDKNPEISHVAKQKAFRAPLIIVGIVSFQENQRVPRWEQKIAAAGVIHNIGLGVYASGFGSIWRTGDFASSDIVREGLKVNSNEEIIGFLYVGSRPEKQRKLKPVAIDDFFSSWGD